MLKEYECRKKWNLKNYHFAVPDKRDVGEKNQLIKSFKSKGAQLFFGEEWRLNLCLDMAAMVRQYTQGPTMRQRSPTESAERCTSGHNPLIFC